jgi:hypothetical protein
MRLRRRNTQRNQERAIHSVLVHKKRRKRYSLYFTALLLCELEGTFLEHFY